MCKTEPAPNVPKEKKMKIKDILKKTIVRDILTNIVYLILIIIYFITFNTQGNLLTTQILIQYINISSLVFLLIGLILMEIGYRKEKHKILINGLEFLVLAIFTLLIKHMPKVLGYTLQDYTKIGAYSFVIYYTLKSGIMYTKMKQDQLKSLSDIKEIVKEEPIKKATKRKNIKEEGK